MVVLQMLKNGQYLLTVNKSVIKATNLKPGAELVYMFVGPFVKAEPGDILIRPTGVIKS
jgi:hypothetical protein